MTVKISEPELETKNGLFYCENSCHASPLTQTTYYNSELETGQITMKIRIKDKRKAEKED